MSTNNKVFKAQNNLYAFPYHYIPHLDQNGHGSVIKRLQWGFEYLCLLTEAKKNILNLKPKSLIDIGCGDGAFLNYMNETEIQLTGIDLSLEAIAFAKAFNPSLKNIHHGDANELPGQYEAVVALEVLEHVPDEHVAGFIDTLVNKVNKNGHIYISVPSINLPLNKKHYRHYDISLLEKHIEPEKHGLKIIKQYYFYKDHKFFKYYNRLCDNRFFTGEFHFLRKWFWKWVCQNASLVGENDGFHVIGVYQKIN